MVLGHRKNTLSKGSEANASADEDEEVVTSEQGNVLTHIISQLRPGADLSRVTLPTFILEPRSMLERITNFMAHPELLSTLPDVDDPLQRFVAVTRFYLSGWHIKPPGVKKPLNPILGELFTGYWDYEDGSKGYYISEQTSHHPPKSSYFFMAPEHHIRIDGTLKPRSKFLGNSVGSFMEGIAVMRFTNRNERYFITQPNMYARGILFGKMKYELGDHAQVRCPETGYEVDIEFKVKGWVSGSYNSIGGFIKDKNGKQLYELSGYWHGEMTIKDLSTGKKEVLYDATHAKPSYPKSRPLNEQAERESQKLWASTTQAIKKADQKVATDEKSKIEDEQRKEASERGENAWKPKLFRPAPAGDEESLDWVIDAEVDDKADPDKQIEQIMAIAPILPGQTWENLSEKSKPRSQTESKKAPSSSQQQQAPKQQQATAQSAPAQHDGGGDLIDFGQHDEPKPTSEATALQTSVAQKPTEGPKDFTEGPDLPIMAKKSQAANTIKRTDSIGNEEVFEDAEQ